MLSPLQLLEFRRDRVSDKDEQFQERQKHPVTESNVMTRIRDEDLRNRFQESGKKSYRCPQLFI